MQIRFRAPASPRVLSPNYGIEVLSVFIKHASLNAAAIRQISPVARNSLVCWPLWKIWLESFAELV